MGQKKWVPPHSVKRAYFYQTITFVPAAYNPSAPRFGRFPTGFPSNRA